MHDAAHYQGNDSLTRWISRPVFRIVSRDIDRAGEKIGYNANSDARNHQNNQPCKNVVVLAVQRVYACRTRDYNY